MAPHPESHGKSIEHVSARLSQLERHNRRLSQLLICICLVIGLLLLASSQLGAPAEAAVADVSPGVLAARELVVVDDKGVVRVRVGANLPDAVIDGKRIGRGGEQVSGIVLYDATGQERGGYVTFEPSGNIGLTLDSKKEQTALFVAGPEGGSALQLWTAADMIELRSDDDGSRLTAVKNGRLVQQIPPFQA